MDWCHIYHHDWCPAERTIRLRRTLGFDLKKLARRVNPFHDAFLAKDVATIHLYVDLVLVADPTNDGFRCGFEALEKSGDVLANAHLEE